MFEDYERPNVVYYEQPDSSHAEGSLKLISVESVAPLQPLRGFFYAQPMYFCDVTVRVEDGTTRATVLKNPWPKPQSRFRNMFNSNIAVGLSVVGSALLIRKGWRGAGRLFWNRTKSRFNEKRRDMGNRLRSRADFALKNIQDGNVHVPS
jgi:hypothetical protein